MIDINIIILFILLLAIVVYILLSYLNKRRGVKSERIPDKTKVLATTIEESVDEMFDNTIRGVFDAVVGGDESEAAPSNLNEYYADLRKMQEKLDPSIKNKIIVQLHYADWCKFCIMIKPAWIKLRKSAGAKENTEFSNYVFLQVDHDKVKAPGIKTIPTVVKQMPDGSMSLYSGNKTYSDLVAWVKK